MAIPKNNIALISARLEMAMMGSIYLEGGVLHEGGEYGSASTGIKASRLSREALSLRCAHYFSDIWHEKIISHNLRHALVENIAKSYVDRGVEFADLVKEGNQGLIHALGNFEFEGGSRFSAYAARCIRQSIERAIMRKSAGSQSDIPEIAPATVIAGSGAVRGVKNNHQSA